MGEFEINGKTLVIGGTRSGKHNPFNPEGFFPLKFMRFKEVFKI